MDLCYAETAREIRYFCVSFSFYLFFSSKFNFLKRSMYCKLSRLSCGFLSQYDDNTVRMFSVPFDLFAIELITCFKNTNQQQCMCNYWLFALAYSQASG